jgi:hypothetical protein
MAPLEMNEGTTTVLGVGHNKETNSCSAEDPAKRTSTFKDAVEIHIELPEKDILFVRLIVLNLTRLIAESYRKIRFQGKFDL